MRSALTRARLVSDKPLDLDKHRGMAEQKSNRHPANSGGRREQRKGPARSAGDTRKPASVGSGASWPEAAAKARYVLNLYAAGLAPADTHHRDLVAVVLADFARLSNES